MSNSPFIPTTTPAIDRANRLMSVRSNPGFLDIIRISQEIVNTATATLVDYGGWDAQQITVLKARAQAAKEHHDMLFAKISEAIREGIEEGKTAEFPKKSVTEISEEGDFVQQKVLEKFQEMDDLRIPGSY